MRINRFIVVIGACLSLTACPSLSPQQKATGAAVAAKVGGTALNLVQFAADSALQLVVAKAVSPEDLTNKTDLLSAGAQGLRSLEGATLGFVTPDEISATVRQFTNPAVSHWGDLADTLAAKYIAAPGQSDAVLEAFATGIDAAAAKAVAQAQLSDGTP